MAAWKSATGKDSYQYVNSRSAEGQAKRTSVSSSSRGAMFEGAALRGGRDSHEYDRDQDTSHDQGGFNAPTQTL
jgi:hypothetical protein